VYWRCGRLLVHLNYAYRLNNKQICLKTVAKVKDVDFIAKCNTGILSLQKFAIVLLNSKETSIGKVC